MLHPVAARPHVSVLMYHQVGHFAAPKTHRAVYCDIRRFEAQMACLKWGGYHVISLSDACNGIFNGAALPSRPVVLTFDDGYKNFYEDAWPVLQKYGYPATVYLVSRLLGKQAGWLDEGKQAPLMEATTIRDLQKEGITFGSHTQTHCRLSKLTEQEQRAEILDSKSELEDVLGEPVVDFCYPYGDYDLRSRDLVIQAGYSSALTCIRGAANTADNPFEIPRKAISYGDNLIGFLWKLQFKNKRKNSSRYNPQHVIEEAGSGRGCMP